MEDAPAFAAAGKERLRVAFVFIVVIVVIVRMTAVPVPAHRRASGAEVTERRDAPSATAGRVSMMDGENAGWAHLDEEGGVGASPRRPMRGPVLAGRFHPEGVLRPLPLSDIDVGGQVQVWYRNDDASRLLLA